MLEKFNQYLEDNGIYDLDDIKREDFDKIFEIKDDFLTRELEVMTYEKFIALLNNHTDKYRFSSAYTEAYDTGLMSGDFMEDMRMAFNCYYSDIICEYLSQFGIE